MIHYSLIGDSAEFHGWFTEVSSVIHSMIDPIFIGDSSEFHWWFIGSPEFYRWFVGVSSVIHWRFIGDSLEFHRWFTGLSSMIHRRLKLCTNRETNRHRLRSHKEGPPLLNNNAYEEAEMHRFRHVFMKHSLNIFHRISLFPTLWWWWSVIPNIIFVLKEEALLKKKTKM